MTATAELIKPIPTDTISLQNGYFTGSAYVYEPDGQTIREISFTVKQPTALSPFYYNKPIQNSDNPFNPPLAFKLDKKPRDGVRPIALVIQARRRPNHLHETDDAILCAVQNLQSLQWETRYFPKNSLELKVWQEALDLLNIQYN